MRRTNLRSAAGPFVGRDLSGVVAPEDSLREFVDSLFAAFAVLFAGGGLGAAGASKERDEGKAAERAEQMDSILHLGDLQVRGGWGGSRRSV